jgi:Arc/MetJ family transcription regulator
MAKIKIDKDVYQRAVQCAGQMGYSSVDEFVEHLIERAIQENAQERNEQEDKAVVEERLKGLGYIE